MKMTNRYKALPYFLGILQTFIGVTAVLGGFGLVSDPSGARMNIPLELLKSSPFVNYFIPGLVLLIVIGIGNILAAGIALLRNRRAGRISLFLGAFLVLYIASEVWFIGLQNFLQPLYFVLGAVESFLGWKLSRADRTGHPAPIGSTRAASPV